MSRRYLFGPVNADFAEQKLKEQRLSGDCLAFNSDGTADLKIEATDNWQTICSRLPADWRPDFVALFLQYAHVPASLWSAPVPVVGLAGDWNLLWHYYRRRLRQCDLVFTDRVGVEALAKEGIEHTRSAILYGCERLYVERAWPDGKRDIDILFVGNLHPSVQRERLSWLGRLALLGKRWNVVIASGVFGEDYRRLLERSRIIFNRGIRGECNHRTFEAAVAGALLFQEEGNREVPVLFHDGQECVYYNGDNLESLLDHYLTHEDERKAIAQAAQSKIAGFTFEKHWDDALKTIAAEWPELKERSRERPVPEEPDELITRIWQMLGCTTGEDATLLSDLRAALETHPNEPALHQAMGLATAHCARHASQAEAALPHFRRAFEIAPTDVMAGLNLAEALTARGQTQAAIDVARKTLTAVEESVSPSAIHAAHFPLAFDLFRVEWERTAWSNAGNPSQEIKAKADVLRWRLHLILGELTGDLNHFRLLHQARPDLPTAQAALGCALARAQRMSEAVPYLRQSSEANPFDANVARACFQALVDVGDKQGQQRFIAERRLLAKAAPHMVPVEPWFAEEVVNGTLPQTATAPSGQADPAWLQTISLDSFQQRHGRVDTSKAICGFTIQRDAHPVLTLLNDCKARRVLEIGTAFGHMTANFTEWTTDDAVIYSMGITEDLQASTNPAQRYENPERAAFGRFANHFGKAHKIFFLQADSLTYDFARLAPLDFVFVDGAHDLKHVLSDTLKSYAALRPGGYLVWHDFNSPTSWVEVRKALEQIAFHEPVIHIAGTEVAFLRKSATAPPPQVRAPQSSGQREAQSFSQRKTRTSTPSQQPQAIREAARGIVWEGDQLSVHSLSLVNRTLCSKLVERGHVLAIRTTDSPQKRTLHASAHLTECFGRLLVEPVNVHIRHQWPPRFNPPPAGHWVIIQPWEFGSLPKEWIAPMSHEVDEIWVPSRFVRDCFIQSGIPAERVQVVPNGVDISRFHPAATPLTLSTKKKFKFLFVGGTIFRKGIDILLEAYAQTFTAADDVCLVVKDMGVGTFYQGQTAEEKIAEHRKRPDAPEIEYLAQTLTDDEQAGLYTACDCLVHPYRGEGFGLPIAEAMACGLPVIVTGYGAALDFCNKENAYLVPAKLGYFEERLVDDLETVDRPWLAEPDREALQGWLRHVVAHLQEAKTKGQVGCRHIRQHFTWDRAVEAIEARLEALRHQPIRRLSPQVVPVESDVPIVKVAGRPRVSLTMIVKNEEDNLAACLTPLVGLVDEMIVVDTGSTDKTREIAARFGAKVPIFPWVDSFAAARNEALRHATGDWIFWMDGDDRLDEENRGKLKALFECLKDDIAGYVMKCLCLPDPQSGSATVVDHVRLFRNHPQVRWEYRVHEQILPSLRRNGGTVRWSDVVIQHTGYQDSSLRKRKLQRDFRLLNVENDERPNDPFTLFNLGSVFQEMGLLSEALPVLQRSLALSDPSDSIVRKLYALLAQCHRHLGQKDLSLDACRKGREFYPDDVELLFHESIARRELNDLTGAESCLLQLMKPHDAKHFASVDTALAGYKARHNLAMLYQEQGRLPEAETQWQTVLREQAGYLPALLGLCEIHLQQGRWHDLERAAERLATEGNRAADAAVMRARGSLARKEFAAARQTLEAVIPEAPSAVWPRQILTHVLLQEGRDFGAADKALRDLLALAPNDNDARHNLAVLCRERGHTPSAVLAPVSNGSPSGEGRPKGDELVSIVVLCCNELEFTRLCLESVLQHSRAPYELILIDNGSTDGTTAYLEKIRGCEGPSCVVVMRNDSNRGFAAGCNQGVAESRGRYVVLLNNDTVVTQNWLDGMIAWALHDWPKVAMVGAVTNHTCAPQQIAVDYADLDGLEEFAARRRRDFTAKALEFPKLTGFCLLVRREVLAQIGGFDERYGVGYFEDDDLCLRARHAGFKLLIALDVFVHHFGSRTFAGLGIDTQKQLLDNFAKFREKWGEEHAAVYRLTEENKEPSNGDQSQ